MYVFRKLRRLLLVLLAASAVVVAASWLFFLDEGSDPLHGAFFYSGTGVEVEFAIPYLRASIGTDLNELEPASGQLHVRLQHRTGQTDTVVFEYRRWAPGKTQEELWSFPRRIGRAGCYTPDEGPIRHWINHESGFYLGYSQTQSTAERLEQRVQIEIPCWLVVIALAICPSVAWVVKPAQRWRRRRRGLCATCGYCLAGAPHARCPECGAPGHEPAGPLA